MDYLARVGDNDILSGLVPTAFGNILCITRLRLALLVKKDARTNSEDDVHSFQDFAKDDLTKSIMSKADEIITYIHVRVCCLTSW